MEPHGADHRIEIGDGGDIEAAIRLVEANYAGWRDKRAVLGETAVRESAHDARDAAKYAALGDVALDGIIREYLRTFRDHHLSLRTPAAGAGDPGPAGCGVHADDFSARSAPRGVYLRFPCFGFGHRTRIDEMLAEHDAAIRDSEELIIDIRGNGGGSDQQWNGLLPYLYTSPFTDPGADFLATPENARLIAGYRRFVPADNTDVLEIIERAVQSAARTPGELVPFVPAQRIEFPEILPRPTRVIFFIDERCASTSEQLLIFARQCAKVRLVGRATRGCIDYSNVLEYPLPSGRRVLGIPCTRSRRLPHDPVDPTGILPDVEVAGDAREEDWFAAARRAFAGT